MQGKTLYFEHFCGLCQILCKHRYVNRVNRHLESNQKLWQNTNVGLRSATGTQYVVSVKKHEICEKTMCICVLCKLHKLVKTGFFDLLPFSAQKLNTNSKNTAKQYG